MSFALRVALSFVLCASYVALIGYVAERVSTKIGGLIAGMPSVLLVSLVFISIQQGNRAASHAALASAITFGGVAIFTVTFAKLAERGITKAYAIGIILWFIMASIGIALAHYRWLPALIGLPTICIALFFTHTDSTTTSLRLPRPPHVLFIQGLLAGGIVALALTASKHLGPTWGGIISGFPIIISSSLIFFWRHHYNSKALTQFALGMPKGTFVTFIFAIIFGVLTLHFGRVWLPLIISYLAALVAAYVLTSVDRGTALKKSANTS